MKQFTENKTIKFSKFHIHCFYVLENVYNIKPSVFVRVAIEEKLKRDIPKLREEKNRKKIPF